MSQEISNRVQALIEQPHNAFHDVLIAALIGTVVIIALHLLLVLLGRHRLVRHARWNLWEKLLYLATLASVAGLGVTSFVAILQFGGLRGWWLFAHMCGAGALVGLLPLLALTWYGPNRFDRPRSGSSARADAPVGRFFWVPKIMFWLLILSGLTVSLTMLLSMLPLFGTETLESLLDIHRYAGLLAVIAIALHFYCVLLQRFGFR